jgi:hypothetical protein
MSGFNITYGACNCELTRSDLFTLGYHDYGTNHTSYTSKRLIVLEIN